MCLPLVWVSTLQAPTISKHSHPIIFINWQTLKNIKNHSNTPGIRWLPPTFNSLLRTSLRLQSQTTWPIQMLCSKTPTRSGAMDGHQTIPRHERCTQIVSIGRFHFSLSTLCRHVRPTCQRQTIMNLLNHGLAAVPYRDYHSRGSPHHYIVDFVFAK
jgi:hypothetical protein